MIPLLFRLLLQLRLCITVIVIKIVIIIFVTIITSMYTSVGDWRNDVTTATVKHIQLKQMRVGLLVSASSNVTMCVVA